MVLGGGPGGYSCAIRCAQRGDRVTLVEARAIGGTCLNRGCIPTKAMYEAARVFRDARRAAEFGVLTGGVSVDGAALLGRRDRVVAALVEGLDRLLAGNGVEVVSGWGRLVPGASRPAVRVGDRVLEADAVVLAPGSRPAPLPVPGTDLPGVLDSDALLALARLPQSLCIIGGGVIGCEFAAILAALGSRVAVVELADQLLPQADAEVARRLALAFRRQGIAVHTAARVSAIEPGGGGLRVTWQGGSAEAEYVLVAVGRRPATEDLGCEQAGIARERGFLAVDERMRTTAPGVWALGDAAAGFPMLAHAAFAQAEVVAADVRGEAGPEAGRPVPNPVFTHPEVAWVGLTEAAAAAQGRAVRVGRFPIAALGRAVIAGETEGFCKVVADAGDARLLGVHAIGPSATELVAEATLALTQGLTADALGAAVHSHPTLSEATGEAAAAAFGHPLHILRRP